MGTAYTRLAVEGCYRDPAIAPSDMTFYTGDMFPAWQGSLFVGGLAREHLVQFMSVPCEQRHQRRDVRGTEVSENDAGAGGGADPPPRQPGVEADCQGAADCGFDGHATSKGKNGTTGTP